jgi:hypothetical protein
VGAVELNFLLEELVGLGLVGLVQVELVQVEPVQRLEN